jgi:hypothetical protein
VDNETGGLPGQLNGPIAGTWHLVDARADEMNIPGHRVDLVLRGEAGGLSGAVLSRVGGQEMLALENVTFDGEVLRFQMPVLRGTNRGDMPLLVMRATGGTFEGHWTQNGAPVGPLLRLIRAHS